MCVAGDQTCRGSARLSVCFHSSQCQVYAYIFEGSIFVLQSMNINMTPKTPHARLFQRSAADWHPLPSPVFLCSPAKEALMGMWCPVSGVLAKFTSHLESPELEELRHCLALWNSLPQSLSWSRSAMRETLSHQHLRNKSDTLLTAAYSEAGGWGITWKEWYSWQIFSLLGKKWALEEGWIFIFFKCWKENSLQFKHTQIEWDIPPSIKYLESVIAGSW